MSAKIFVGYRTKAHDDIESMMPTFKAPSNWKDAEKINAHIEEQRAAFLLEAKDQPYTGTFDAVWLYDNKMQKPMPFLSEASATKGPVSKRVRNYLLKTYKEAWSDDTANTGKCEVVIIGFAPRLFLKIMGLECSMPHIDERCPLGMWYSNSDHRDIGEAVMPRECGKLDLPTVLRCRQPVDTDDNKAKWKALTNNWNGPGVNPEADVKIAYVLAHQLGFLAEKKDDKKASQDDAAAAK